MKCRNCQKKYVNQEGYVCAFCNEGYCLECGDCVCSRCGCCSACELGEPTVYKEEICFNCKTSLSQEPEALGSFIVRNENDTSILGQFHSFENARIQLEILVNNFPKETFVLEKISDDHNTLIMKLNFHLLN